MTLLQKVRHHVLWKCIYTCTLIVHLWYRNGKLLSVHDPVHSQNQQRLQLPWELRTWWRLHSYGFVLLRLIPSSLDQICNTRIDYMKSTTRWICPSDVTQSFLVRAEGFLLRLIGAAGLYYALLLELHRTKTICSYSSRQFLELGHARQPAGSVWTKHQEAAGRRRVEVRRVRVGAARHRRQVLLGGGGTAQRLDRDWRRWRLRAGGTLDVGVARRHGRQRRQRHRRMVLQRRGVIFVVLLQRAFSTSTAGASQLSTRCRRGSLELRGRRRGLLRTSYRPRLPRRCRLPGLVPRQFVGVGPAGRQVVSVRRTRYGRRPRSYAGREVSGTSFCSLDDVYTGVVTCGTRLRNASSWRQRSRLFPLGTKRAECQSTVVAILAEPMSAVRQWVVFSAGQRLVVCDAVHRRLCLLYTIKQQSERIYFSLHPLLLPRCMDVDAV